MLSCYMHCIHKNTTRTERVIETSSDSEYLVISIIYIYTPNNLLNFSIFLTDLLVNNLWNVIIVQYFSAYQII